MPARSPSTPSRAVLSPRPAPRQQSAVVVVAQKALAEAALNWQERAESLAAANARLKERVQAVENAHRKSLTVVKNVPALPNNHVFTKQLVDENHSLRRQTRELQRRLLQFEGPRSRRAASKSARQPRSDNSKHAQKELPRVTTVRSKNGVEEETQDADSQHEPASPKRELVIDLARHPLVQELKTHLGKLEVDLERLRQENELLRVELVQHQIDDNQSEKKQQPRPESYTARDVQDLRACATAQLQQMKMLEARYQHLQEKARAKHSLYEETIARLEDTNAQLFAAQQQLAVQAEKLQLYSDQTAQVDDLQQDVHLLRSENLKLNETIATLSSRPFDALSNDLHKKNLWIAQLEQESRDLEEDRDKLRQDCVATRKVNDQLRRRVETMTTEVNDLAYELTQAKAEVEQQCVEKQVAQLQLRFYTSPNDYELLNAVGKALKEMRKKEAKEATGGARSALEEAKQT